MNREQRDSVAKMRRLADALDGVVAAAKTANKLGLAYAALMLQEAIEIYAVQCEAHYEQAGR